MNDLRRALADISDIRQNLAAGSLFRGFGPHAIAATGLLALATAWLQSKLLPSTASEPITFLAVWIALAIVCVAIIGAEMLARTRRHHGGLADAMLLNAVEAFLPAGAAGAALALVMIVFAPENVWLLPGLWQMMLSLGVFAALRALPRAVALAAAWYFVSGVATIILCSETRELSPWAMGLPFGVGQLLLAAILRRTMGDEHGE